MRMMNRKSGIILPIFSLPGKYGIGTLGQTAYDFADFLKKSGQFYWQVLPLGHSKNGSPYEVISAFAGNPYLIDLEILLKEGLLNHREIDENFFGEGCKKIDYPQLYTWKEKILRIAFSRIDNSIYDSMAKFKMENYWLEEYSLYCSLNSYFKTDGWTEWNELLRLRDEQTIKYYKNLLSKEMDFWCFIQYEFSKQWTKLKNYINEIGCQVIGDIPFYVSLNSVDVWIHPELFKLDNNKNTVGVAGCPPDNFSDEGQYWGYPVYDWDKNRENNYEWWIYRIMESRKLFDVIRLDHFIGFQRYWEIPAESKVVSKGKWVVSAGKDFFDTLKRKLGDINLIVEDLGAIDKDVVELKKQVKCKGMKVLLLAFDSREKIECRPHTYDKSVVAYTTVHDTDTVIGWMSKAKKEDREHAIQYLHLDETEEYNWGFIRGCWSSVADIAMTQMQDVIGLGSDSRMNLPPLLPNNWVWRMKSEEMTDKIANKLYQVTELYDRLNNDNSVKRNNL
jgi:4-alpha-glucanotransferase